jgi:hypothetical protein
VVWGLGSSPRASLWRREIGENDDTLSLTSPVVVEVHEAAPELIRATGARDLVGASGVLDALVLETR